MRTLCPIFLAMLLPAAGGCVYEPEGPADVPLAVKDARSGQPVRGVVVVSAVRSTGWYPFVQIKSRPHPFDKVRVDRIARVDSPTASLHMPRHLPASGFLLGLIVNERPELLAFAPGYRVGGNVRVLLDGVPTDWGYRQSAYQKKASVEISLTPLSPATTASRPAENDPCRRTCELLEDETFWRALRERASGPRAKQDIQCVCRALLDDADAIQRQNPPFVWKRAQRETLDACRKAAAAQTP